MRRSAQSANAAVSRRAVSRVQLRSDRAPLPNCSPSPRAPRRSPSGKPQPASLPPQDHSPETPSFYSAHPATYALTAQNRALAHRKLAMPRIPIAQTSKIFAPYSSTIYRYSTPNPPNRPSILKVGQAVYPLGPPATEPSSDTRATHMSTLRQIEANRRNAQKSTGPTSVTGKAAPTPTPPVAPDPPALQPPTLPPSPKATSPQIGFVPSTPIPAPPQPAPAAPDPGPAATLRAQVRHTGEQTDRSPTSTPHTRSLVRTEMMENGSGS